MSSNPNGASVYVNEHLGVTPIERYPLAEGNYNPKLTLEGYSNLVGIFNITANQVTAEDLELKRLETTPAVFGPKCQ
ncbi:MAG: PEGA domain-containing protein [Deinococcales bacterium]